MSTLASRIVMLGGLTALVACSSGKAEHDGDVAERTLDQALVAAFDGADAGPPEDDPCAAVRCAAGTHCVANGDSATCTPDVFCGGIAAFTCPGAGECIDDPYDDCDPGAGGADCGGLCQCSGALVLCAPGTVFDESPDVCACIEQITCASVLCIEGTHCEEKGGEPTCVPNRRHHRHHRHGHRGRRHHHHHHGR